MRLKLFSRGKIDTFAKNLADEIARRYPPTIANNPEQMVSQMRLTSILEDAFSKAADFRMENRLGWFARAKLVNEFQWELKDAGYEKKFVELATEGLLVYVTRGKLASTRS